MTDNSISQMVLSSEQMGDVSIAGICMNELMNWPKELLVAQIETDFYELAYLMCRGGWKENRNASPGVASLYPTRMCQRVSHEIHKNHMRTMRVLRQCAHDLCCLLCIERMSAHIKAREGYNISRATLRTFIDLMDIPKHILRFTVPVCDKLPGGRIMRKNYFLYFCDPSMAVAMMGLTPETLLKNPQYMRRVFENMVIRDMSIYARKEQGCVCHYYDSYRLRCFVIEFGDSQPQYALFDTAMDGTDAAINAAAKRLNRVERILTLAYGDKRPLFKLVITGTTYRAYMRKTDNVHVVSLLCLCGSRYGPEWRRDRSEMYRPTRYQY